MEEEVNTTTTTSTTTQAPVASLKDSLSQKLAEVKRQLVLDTDAAKKAQIALSDAQNELSAALDAVSDDNSNVEQLTALISVL